ncbi:MAG: hypothetical protein VX475_00020, partial [Myxococcota bacterium]|nr:hypothetical protein [Myxococcota bacterium]
MTQYKQTDKNMNTTDTKPPRLTIPAQGDLRISAPDTPTVTLALQEALEEATMPILGKALAAADGARKTEEGALVLVDPTTEAKLKLTPRGEGGA